MTAEEFVKNFYQEKQNIFNSCFDHQPEHQTLVSTGTSNTCINENKGIKFR